MVSAIDASKKNVRYVPDSSRMTNEYIAISPIMNDQWSGKTLFSPRRTGPAMVNRESTQSATLSAGLLVAAVV